MSWIMITLPTSRFQVTASANTQSLTFTGRQIKLLTTNLTSDSECDYFSGMIDAEKDMEILKGKKLYQSIPFA